MTRDEEMDIEFYKGGAIHNVLKRFHFSDEEKKTITAAIITSRRETPNIKIIRMADTLLKEIAKTREPLEPEIKTEVSPEAIAKFEAMSIKKRATDKNYAESQTNKSNFLRMDSKVMIVFAGSILLAFMFYNSFYKKDLPKLIGTFTEAKQTCKSIGKVLPLTYEDFSRISLYGQNNDAGYWNNEGKIYYNLAKPLMKDDKSVHHIKCIAANGLESSNRFQ